VSAADARALVARLLAGGEPDIDLAELDSMDFLALVTALYEETGIDIPERDYPLIASAGGLAAFLAGKGWAGTTSTGTGA